MSGSLRYFTFKCKILSTGEDHHFIYVVHRGVEDPIMEIKLHLAAQALDDEIPLHIANLPYLFQQLGGMINENDTRDQSE